MAPGKAVDLTNTPLSMQPPAKLYKFHVANLRAIDTATERTALTLRDAIARQDEKTVSSFRCLYAFLLAASAECRLQKLLYEPNGFSDDERNRVQEQESHSVRWQATIDTAFRKHYSVPSAALSENTLPHSAWARYKTISGILDDELRPIIELRNKLAHGQWEYPLNEPCTDVAQEQMDALRKENLLSLQFKRKLITSLTILIHDLVTSRSTFERDFDKHFNLIVASRRDLQNRSYGYYSKTLQGKFQRGKAKRQAG